MSKLSRREIVTLLGVEEDFLVWLESEQIVRCDERGEYSSDDAERARVGWIIHHELGVNHEGVDVALHLLECMLEERRRYGAVLERLRRRLDEMVGD